MERLSQKSFHIIHESYLNSKQICTIDGMVYYGDDDRSKKKNNVMIRWFFLLKSGHIVECDEKRKEKKIINETN